MGGRQYAPAGTTDFGMHIIDITKPTTPVKVATDDCPIHQGDIQVWKKNKRVYASYTADSSSAPPVLHRGVARTWRPPSRNRASPPRTPSAR